MITVPGLRLRTDRSRYRDIGHGGRQTSVTTRDGVHLHLEVDGPQTAAVTLVFVHGYTLDLSSWREQRAALAGSPTRRVFYDSRAFGRSGRGVPGAASVRQLAEDLAEVIAAEASTGQVVLVGHSMGVMVIFSLAGLYPQLFGDRIRAAVLVAGPATGLRDLTLGLPRHLARMLHSVLPSAATGLARVPLVVEAAGQAPFLLAARHAMCDRTASAKVRRICADLVSANRLDVLADYARALQDFDELDALPVFRRVQTVVLVGTHDRLVPKRYTDQVIAALPDAEVVEVADCGHMIPLEHPEAVDDCLRAVVAAALTRA